VRADGETDYPFIGDVSDRREMLRLRIAAGGAADWYCFSAEVRRGGVAPLVVAMFDVAPIELLASDTFQDASGDAGRWTPEDEPDFLKIPVEYRKTFALMVFIWGRLASAVMPAPAWLTVRLTLGTAPRQGRGRSAR
jgi:hypothetical protein